jgi:hypothetical protein
MVNINAKAYSFTILHEVQRFSRKMYMKVVDY